ncbi:MAG: hypothetical protein BJ554DRAFT_5135 [Olpidium bornovanus]|uniref:Uncharacterized protein n=1 Tax=Olpidium bornovanus TaxID=278681 RepID=A0A8H7ZLS0_9FUNG|nr:MAG: hypothetical protein BJ554DRAFT_5135 [Olpidium bornovanus]
MTSAPWPRLHLDVSRAYIKRVAFAHFLNLNRTSRPRSGPTSRPRARACKYEFPDKAARRFRTALVTPRYRPGSGVLFPLGLCKNTIQLNYGPPTPALSTPHKNGNGGARRRRRRRGAAAASGRGGRGRGGGPANIGRAAAEHPAGLGHRAPAPPGRRAGRLLPVAAAPAGRPDPRPGLAGLGGASPRAGSQPEGAHGRGRRGGETGLAHVLIVLPLEGALNREGAERECGASLRLELMPPAWRFRRLLENPGDGRGDRPSKRLPSPAQCSCHRVIHMLPPLVLCGRAGRGAPDAREAGKDADGGG